MLKITKIFSRKKNKKPDLVKPDLHTHRKSPLDPLRATSLAEDAISETENLIKKFGPRLTGSQSCKECASSINERLSEYCDFTAKQEFKHKGLAYGLWIRLIPYVYITSLILLIFGMPILSLLIVLFFSFYVYREYIVYKPIFESKVKDSDGVNVHGVIEPEEEVKNTVIFTSHHDSAPLLTNNRGEKGYFLNVELPIILFGLAIIMNIVEIIVELLTNRILKVGFPPLTTIVIIVLLLAASPIVFRIINYYSKEASPGAGDNLISSSILIQLSRYFKWKKDCGEGLSNTRLVFASFDAEEVGLRGSSVWFDKHQALFENPIQLNFDCLYNADDLVFIDSDINGLMPLSKELAQKCVKLAVAMGYKAKNHPLPFLSGATDAASGYKAKVKACTLMALDFDNGIKNSFFHTKNDTIDKIEEKAVEKAISIAIKLTNTIDDNDFYEDTLIKSEEKKEEESEDLIKSLKFNKISRR